MFLVKLARTARESFPGLKAPDSTIGHCLVGYLLALILLLPHTTSALMERPLEDATTANLWKTLFALIVELSLRSGLVTQEELVPALATTRPSTASQEEGSQEGQEEGTGDQELGEESDKEEGPVVEVAREPDAETEPGATRGEDAAGGYYSSASAPGVPYDDQCGSRE